MELKEIRKKINDTESAIEKLLEELQTDINTEIDNVSVETWRYKVVEWTSRATVRITIKIRR